MGKAQTMEKEFESNIADGLEASGWTYSGEANCDGWASELALFPEDVIHWLSTQYPGEYRKAIPETLTGPALRAAEVKLCKRIASVLAMKVQVDSMTGKEKNGLLGVLRAGFEYAQTGRPAAKFGPLASFQPANPALTKVQESYNANRLRVIRQVYFDTQSRQTIDLVLTVNGVPVITMELKTDNTQSAKDGIEQYMTSRVPSKTTPLLMPGRCLVHFVVSNQVVEMTSLLAGRDTKFLPFNQGKNGHSGNPPSETGSPTDFLWRQVLTPASLLRILQSYALRETSGQLVFPRFHQLRATEKVTADVVKRGAGGRYLIWHSAGSGKTKTIAWLAHRLARTYDAEGVKVFDSVIVISDRQVLDGQLRRAVGLLGAAKGFVVAVGEKSGPKNPVLRQALEEGDHLITCTLQSFPEVMKHIEGREDLMGRRWCVIADEAHSSQTGDSALSLRKLLADQDVPDDEEISNDDLLLAQGKAVALTSNMTFIALTATPKHRTLQMFGTQDEQGHWHAFDTYTMAQAIEEGFILDVLTRYSTYDMFASVRDDKNTEALVDQGKAVKEIVKFVRLHRTAIAQKVQIVIEHFRANVASSLNGRAKAMVVTEGRQAAVRWSKEMNAYLAKKGYNDMTTLVAFSATVKDNGVEYTERGMNKVVDTAKHFHENDDAKVLIVANKYQTGFDEPLLCAMYVDKNLSGIAAIQTLSRLNRAFPNKPLPVVLDFVNSAAEIQAAFADYYTDAHVEQETDPNALYDLGARIDAAGYYTEQELLDISDSYITDHDGEDLAKLVSIPVDRWREDVNYADSSAKVEAAMEFKSGLRKYANAWDFLSQVIDYQDPFLQRRAIVARLLERQLHLDSLVDNVDVSSVALTGIAHIQREDGNYSLSEGNDDPLQPSQYDGEPKHETGAEQVALDEVIDEVNRLFSASGVNLGSGSGATWTRAVWGVLSSDPEVIAMSKENTPEQLAASPKFHDKVDEAMVTVAAESAAMTQAAMSDLDLSTGITDSLAKVMVVANSVHA